MQKVVYIKYMTEGVLYVQKANYFDGKEFEMECFRKIVLIAVMRKNESFSDNIFKNTIFCC